MARGFPRFEDHNRLRGRLLFGFPRRGSDSRIASHGLSQAVWAASLSAVVALVSSFLENTTSIRAPLLTTTVRLGRN